MSRLHSRAARHPLSQERSTGLVESDDDASPTLTTTRRRLHYIDFGRLELFLRRRLNEANERQNQQRQEPTEAVAVSRSIPSPMTTQPGTVNATPAALNTRTPPRSADNRPRTWLRQANTARRRIAQRLSRVIAGCLRGGEAGGEDAACADVRKDDDGRDGGEGKSFDNRLRMRTLSVGGRPRARTSYQRCNNATGSSDRGSVLNPNREDAIAKSSVTGATASPASTAAAAAVGVEKEPPSKALQTIDAVEIVEVEEVASAARTLSLRPAGPSGGSSPRSCATTLSAATPTQPISLPPSAFPSKAAPTLLSKRPTPPRRRRQRLPEQPKQQGNNTSRRSYCTDAVVDDRTALLRTGSQMAAEDEDAEDRIVNWNATKNTDKLKAKAKGGKGVRSAGGANEKPREFTPQPGAGNVKKIAKKQTKSRPVKRVKTATASHTTADKLVTLTSEGVAWSDQLQSLTKAPITNLYRPGAAERPAAQPLQEDPLHDPPKTVTLRRNIECPLVPLMTYKTDKKGELFYSVVQMCQMCRKDVCPKCRRSLCAFCTAITCSDCRMLLHQMIEISRVDGGGRQNRPSQSQSLVRAGSSQQQPQPYCHSCEKPVCLTCINGLAMILPTNERCAQHSLSGNVYENTCPWCGRTICRECRRSSCFACTKAFQCACQGSCQCDSRAALPNS